MALLKKLAKKVGKAAKKVLPPTASPVAKARAFGQRGVEMAKKGIGGNPSPSLSKVVKVAKLYNPVTGPVGAIKKVTRALQAPPPQKRRR